MDLTLIFATCFTPDTQTKPDEYSIVRNEEFGGDIYVYKRPHLDEFLTRLQDLGTVSIFAANQQKYADPILNQIDPCNKFFKHRFYHDSCVKGSDGQILKDMSVLQFLVEEQQPQQAQQSWFAKLVAKKAQQQHSIVNIMNSDIVLGRDLLERLVIVDDSITTYNAYKNNTIRV